MLTDTSTQHQHTAEENVLIRTRDKLALAS